MYDLATVVPTADLDPGTNVLLTGEPLTGKRNLGLDVLASGATRGEGSIVVTTKDSADKVLSTFDGRLGPDTTIADVDVGIVDCVSRQRGVETTEADPRIKYASSPVDMTGVGIGVSEFLQEFYESRGLSRNRILLHSISTLLMYTDLKTVFRFLHVFTGRVQSADALGIYVIDSTAHDDETMNTLKQLFDGLIEVSEGDGVEPDVRTAGIS
ncbi:RAD55 family ATPase [Natrialbaceae archaeon AArc-T1-2]|uniref:RAD55 family ATPase n=1 Tax=Natrialbaceae archaeon AArc-T1-2 TaxID=3053904 RepID=UPI00255A90CA|nr:recombinase RecA [Natrialbaceae archaeon AArc-T1-2]WIV66301.1 recombinase RecA [Natrialbaceae archaeon AArc-T1-2]